MKENINTKINIIIEYIVFYNGIMVSMLYILNQHQDLNPRPIYTSDHEFRALTTALLFWAHKVVTKIRVQ